MQRAADRPVLGKPPPWRAPTETGGSARPFMAKRWIQVAPLGEFPHTAAGVVQVIDADAVRAMAESFDASRKLLVDFDHYSDLSSAQRAAVEAAGVALPTKAAGWIEQVEPRDDGLYALANLNRAGERAIEGEEYRYVSPVWLRGDCEVVGPGKVRPRKLYKVGLTNEPNIRALPSLTNRDAAEPMAGPLVELKNSLQVESSAVVVEPETTESDHMREKLIALLGLSADATDDAILAAIGALKAAQAEAESLANRVASAEAKAMEADKAALAAKVEAALAEHAGKIANRDDVRAALMANYDAVIEVLKSIKPAVKMSNRADTNPPVAEEKVELRGMDRVLAAFRAGKN